MLFLVCSIVAFVEFPESKDSIFAHENKESIKVDVSGSLGVYHDGKCHKTYGNSTVVTNRKAEWCSNIAKVKGNPDYNPFIQYSIKGKRMKVSRYSVRNGCCDYACCCEEEGGKIIDEACCCYLYSYSLQASNDNKTWTVLHKVEKDRTFSYCLIKTFELEKISDPYKYFRFVMDEEWPGCPKCMQINQIELYGETISSFDEIPECNEEDESISIIGRVRRDE